MAAAILLTSAIAPPSSYSAYAEKKDKHEEIKKKIDEIQQRIISAVTERNNGGTFTATKMTIKAEGLALTRSNSGVDADDAALDLSGQTYKREGSHVKTALNGTLAVGIDQYRVSAEGRAKLQGNLETLHLTGKATKGSEEERFQLKAMLIESWDGKWSLVVDSAARLGSHTKIYGLLGKLKTTTGTAGWQQQQPASPALDHFKISAIGNQTAAGIQFTFTVTAIDTNGNIKSDYNGTVTIATNAGSSPYGNASTITPDPYTFTAADKGKHMFTTKMYNAKSNVTIIVSGSGETVTSNKFIVPAAIAKGVYCRRMQPCIQTTPRPLTQRRLTYTVIRCLQALSER